MRDTVTPNNIPYAIARYSADELKDALKKMYLIRKFEEGAEDSYNLLPIFLGTQGETPVRSFMLQQTMSLEMSIRDGQWKYLDHKGSGGNNYSRPHLKSYVLEDTDPQAPGQLYNLENDPGETTNLYSQHPEIVKEMKERLETFKSSGRSAPLR